MVKFFKEFVNLLVLVGGLLLLNELVKISNKLFVCRWEKFSLFRV